MTSSQAHSVNVLERPTLGHVEARGPESADDLAWRRTGATLFLRYAVMALALTAVGVAIVHLDLLAGLREWDLSVSRWFAQHRGPGWDDVAMFWSHVADTMAIVGVAVVAAVVLLVRDRRRAAALIACGLVLEAATFITVNHLVRRERPPVDTVGDAPTTFSFPSGHVAATIVLYGALALLVHRSVRSAVLRALVWLVPVVFAACVAFARVYRGVHFTTDVLAGIALGVVALVVTSALLRRDDARPSEERP